MSPLDLALYRQVDELLFYVWDPIGISHVAAARDEYQGYLPDVFALLQSGASEAQLADLLLQIAQVRMGLPGDGECARRLARQLVDVREYHASSCTAAP